MAARGMPAGYFPGGTAASRLPTAPPAPMTPASSLGGGKPPSGPPMPPPMGVVSGGGGGSTSSGQTRSCRMRPRRPSSLKWRITPAAKSVTSAPSEEPGQLRLLEREARPDLELGAARLAERVAPVAGVARKAVARLRAHARHLPGEEVRGVDVAALERRAFEHQRHRVLLGEDRRLIGEDEPPEPIGEVEAPIRRLRHRRRHEHAARGVEVELTELPREAEREEVVRADLPEGAAVHASRRRVARREALRDRLQGRIVFLGREGKRA